MCKKNKLGFYGVWRYVQELYHVSEFLDSPHLFAFTQLIHVFLKCKAPHLFQPWPGKSQRSRLCFF